MVASAWRAKNRSGGYRAAVSVEKAKRFSKPESDVSIRRDGLNKIS